MRNWMERWIRGEDWMFRAVRRGLAAYVREMRPAESDQPAADRDRADGPDAGREAEAATTIP